MAIRPQCARLVTSYYTESAYGTQVPDGSIDKMFELSEPALPDIKMERGDDAEFIKGHEWPEDLTMDYVITQDVSVPFSFKASLSLLGMLYSFGMGNASVAGVANPYTHTFKDMALCGTPTEWTIGDQPPSTSWVLMLMGDTASYHTVKGVCINELRLAMTGTTYLDVTGTAICDGSWTANADHSLPGSSSHADWLYGTQADLWISNDGVTPTIANTLKSIFRGFEFTINNNLDVADGRGNAAASSTAYLTSLRYGERQRNLTFTVQGHIGDARHADFMAGTTKSLKIVLTKSVTRTFEIYFEHCKYMTCVPRFDGTRDVLEITLKPYYIAANSGPCVVTLLNGVAAYLL